MWCSLVPGELARSRVIVRKLGDDPPYPVVFAALYGDEAAGELGYEKLGLAPWAGFEVALADAIEHGRDPVKALSDRNSRR